MQPIPFKLELTDKFGTSVSFEDTQELRDFVTREQADWHWLADAPHTQVNLEEQFLNAFNLMLNWISSAEGNPAEHQTVRSNFVSRYAGDRPPLLMSEAQPAIAINLIRAKLGVGPAERALSFVTGKVSCDPSSYEDVRIMQLVAMPSQIEAEVWLAEQQRKLASARTALNTEIRKYREATASLTAAQTAINTRERGRYRKIASMLLTLSKRRADVVRASATDQIGQIEATRKAYEEGMRLKAPVEYWEGKRNSHGTASTRWGIGAGIYLVVAAIAAAFIFDLAWDKVGDNAALSGKHFLLVAAVGSFITLLFWIARIAVRIYLGERHLFTDAEERRVMTQAYLALIKESAASDNERIVILSALFRSAQDGIVKEDSGGEVGLPAVLARLMDPRAK